MKYVADKGEKAVFQYVDEGRHCREHLHLKCVQCGRIYHLDCHFMDEVRAHLMAEHGFTLQCEGSVHDAKIAGGGCRKTAPSLLM
jgi:Fur family ferric uptake transcriptional regulator